jgi:hypothetical protein
MKKLTFLLLAILLLPATSFANGGDQRVIENKYLINLSRAPFTPIVGVKTSFLASLVDIQKNKLLSEDIVVNIRISKLGEAPKGNFIFEQNNIAVKGGVLDFPYTFSNSGLHEIFFDFAFASNPQQVYNAPDFLIDVQKPETEKKTNNLLIGVFIFGITIGVVADFMFGLWFRQQKA